MLAFRRSPRLAYSYGCAYPGNMPFITPMRALSSRPRLEHKLRCAARDEDLGYCRPNTRAVLPGSKERFLRRQQNCRRSLQREATPKQRSSNGSSRPSPFRSVTSASSGFLCCNCCCFCCRRSGGGSGIRCDVRRLQQQRRRRLPSSDGSMMMTTTMTT